MNLLTLDFTDAQLADVTNAFRAYLESHPITQGDHSVEEHFAGICREWLEKQPDHIRRDGFSCECGAYYEFAGIVYEHWNTPFDHQCRNCGSVHVIHAGHARLKSCPAELAKRGCRLTTIRDLLKDARDLIRGECDCRTPEYRALEALYLVVDALDLELAHWTASTSNRAFVIAGMKPLYFVCNEQMQRVDESGNVIEQETLAAS